MCQPETRIGRDTRQRRVVCFNQSPSGLWPRRPMRRGLKIASDHAEILRPSGVRYQDGQRRSCRPRGRPVLGAGSGLLKRLQHTLCVALRGTGIANTPRRKVTPACIQLLEQCPRSLPADPLVHASRHPRHLVSARYHVQGPVRSTGFSPGNPTCAPPAPLHVPSPVCIVDTREQCV